MHASTLAPTHETPDTADVAVTRVRGGHATQARDRLAVEEPLEIRLHVETPRRLVHETVSVTMRTPGHDDELAIGYLVAEGVVRSRNAIVDVEPCDAADERGVHRAVRVRLVPGTDVDLARLARHTLATSACGACGKTSLSAVRTPPYAPLPLGGPRLHASQVHALPAALRAAQAVFEQTGGLHAAALFALSADEVPNALPLTCLREDVGRHNAVDKVVGARCLAGALPAHDCALLVSGRASYELAQKAVMAGIPILAAVGAPSSLAVELAEAAGLTLLGFVRDERFNVYAGAHRVLA